MDSDTERGQVYIIGYILIIATIVVTSAFIFGAVSMSTQSAIDSDQTTVAEWSITNIDTEIKTPPYTDQERSHAVSTPIQQNIRYNGETTIEISRYSDSGDLEEAYMNRTTHAVQYINPETGSVLTYTLGGLWNNELNETRITPELRQRGDTVTLNPVIVTDVSETAVSPGAIETKNVSYTRVYPQQSDSATISDGSIRVAVSGAGWGDIATTLETQTEAQVTRYPSNSTAVATFDTSTGRTRYRLAINTYTAEIAY